MVLTELLNAIHKVQEVVQLDVKLNGGEVQLDTTYGLSHSQPESAKLLTAI